jgi:hypothetical protein
MEKKIDRLLVMMRSGNWDGAIKFAAKFPRLGESRDDILRAKDAINNPDFFRQIGKDPLKLIELGRAALIFRYHSALASV